MAIGTAELIARLDVAIDARSSDIDPVGRGRRLFLEHVRDLVRRYGLPLPVEYSLEACVMPYVFQELNYDGRDWSNRLEDFGGLSHIINLDAIVWSGGQERMELTDGEFADYHQFCHRAIEYRARN